MREAISLNKICTAKINLTISLNKVQEELLCIKLLKMHFVGLSSATIT